MENLSIQCLSATGVIAGIPPINMIALEWKEKYEGETAGELDSFLTQALSGKAALENSYRKGTGRVSRM